MKLADYLKTSHKTHLVFDFDETLLKLILPWEKAVEGIKDKLISLDKKAYEDYEKEKISLSPLENRYVLDFGEEILNLIIKNRLEFERNYLKGVIPNKSFINIVKNLSSYEMFIWSSNTRPTIEKFLKEYGILYKFKKIVSREDVKLLKPEIDGFELLYDVKIPKENYLFIGDSKFDRIAAKKASIDFYFVDFFSRSGKYW